MLTWRKSNLLFLTTLVMPSHGVHHVILYDITNVSHDLTQLLTDHGMHSNLSKVSRYTGGYSVTWRALCGGDQATIT